MLTAKNASVLAPYGSMKLICLATKVGNGKNHLPLLAPYGSVKFIPLATKQAKVPSPVK